MSYKSLRISPEDKEVLRKEFLKTPEVIPLSSNPKFFSKIISLGIHQEVGTIHDEFSTFLFDGRTGKKIPKEALRSEMIEYRGYTGVRIWADGYDSLDPRVQGMRTLMHPEFSCNTRGEIYQCVFFPEIITRIAALEGAELVSVRPWGINTVFGGFDPTKSYYEGNMWEFINLDALRYSRLLEKKQIVFWGTHDLVSHIAGIRKEAWPELEARGRSARILFEDYFSGMDRPVPFSLVLPYALGMLLDDLAQPMNYESESRRHVVGLLMDAIKTRKIKPDSKRYLLKYPPSVERLIVLARTNDSQETRQHASEVLSDLISELYSYSVLADIAS
ncbi:MAG: hypothetical protein ACJ763_07375 [Bdellovibrionia bacterium]